MSRSGSIQWTSIRDALGGYAARSSASSAPAGRPGPRRPRRRPAARASQRLERGRAERPALVARPVPAREVAAAEDVDDDRQHDRRDDARRLERLPAVRAARRRLIPTSRRRPRAWSTKSGKHDERAVEDEVPRVDDAAREVVHVRPHRDVRADVVHRRPFARDELADAEDEEDEEDERGPYHREELRPRERARAEAERRGTPRRRGGRRGTRSPRRASRASPVRAEDDEVEHRRHPHGDVRRQHRGVLREDDGRARDGRGHQRSRSSRSAALRRRGASSSGARARRERGRGARCSRRTPTSGVSSPVGVRLAARSGRRGDRSASPARRGRRR